MLEIKRISTSVPKKGEETFVEVWYKCEEELDKETFIDRVVKIVKKSRPKRFYLTYSKDGHYKRKYYKGNLPGHVIRMYIEKEPQLVKNSLEVWI